MAQWTFKYTTVKDPSNYITITGHVINRRIAEFPYELAESFTNNNPELMNVSFIFPNTVNYISFISYIANNGQNNGTFNPQYFFNTIKNIEDFYDVSNCTHLFANGFQNFSMLKSINNLYNTSNKYG